MRQIRIATLTCSAVAAGLIMAGCADDTTPAEDTTTAPTATTSAVPSPGTNTVASCTVGQWRSTALAADTDGGTADADLTGGADIGVTIDPTGTTTIDFSDMQPITFTARLGTADIRGSFTYAGRATGTMATAPATSASPSASMSTAAETTGTWQPVGDLNWNDTRLTVDLTEPVQARPFDNIAIGQYTGDAAEQTGNVVDIDPFFDNGRYTCGNDTLTTSPDDDGDLPLNLRRA